MLLVGSGVTTGINLIYNVAIARYLGPTGYGQAAVVYTLLTLLSAITLSFQIISAKFAAQPPRGTADHKRQGPDLDPCPGEPNRHLRPCVSRPAVDLGVAEITMNVDRRGLDLALAGG